jgi:hypothetical protein
MFRHAMALFVTVLWCANPMGAESGPQPPCDAEPVPSYAAPDASPTVKVWSASDLGEWKPSACTGSDVHPDILR